MNIRKTRTLTIWATEEQVARIDRMARAKRISRSGLLRDLINIGFVEYRKKWSPSAPATGNGRGVSSPNQEERKS